MATGFIGKGLNTFLLILSIGGRSLRNGIRHIDHVDMHEISRTLEPRGIDFCSVSKPILALTFYQLVAFLLTINQHNPYHATKFHADGRYQEWTNLSKIFCDKCARDTGGIQCHKHNFAPVDPLLEPSFLVWAVCPKIGNPEFLVRLHSICPHMAASGMWKPPLKAVNRLYEFTLDCDPGVSRYNAHPDIKDCPLLFPFGRYLIKENKFNPNDRLFLEGSCLPRATDDRWKRQVTHTEDLTHWIDNLPGYKVLRLAKNSSTKYQYRIGEQAYDIVGLTWIAPWAQAAWNEGQYEELDASFYVARPFVFCVPQIVISNEAIPIGFIWTPTERNTTYRAFHTDFASANPDFRLKSPYIILSDEGPGLISFGKEQQKKKHWKHFFCHRHLIEKFGAGGWLGMLVTQILRLQTEEEYEELRPVFLEIAFQWFLGGLIDWDHFGKFHTFLAKKFLHGIWVREGDGVSTCSNHAERFHGVVKAICKDKRLKALVLRGDELVKAINAKYDSYCHCPRRQLWHTIDQLIEYHDYSGPVCHLPGCADYCRITAKRFGTRTFPCRHTAEDWKAHAKEGVDEEIPPLPKIPPGDSSPRLDILWVDMPGPQQNGKKFLKQSRRHGSDLLTEHTANSPGKDKLYEYDVSSVPEYPMARTIVKGVRYFSKHRGFADRIILFAYWVLSHWTSEYSKRKKEKKSKREMDDWQAAYAAMWWQWAAKGDLRKCPVELPLQPEPSPAAALKPTSIDAPEPTPTAAPEPPSPDSESGPADPPDYDATGADFSTPPGPPNVHNTCFMNAIVQCLFSIEPLRDFFLADLPQWFAMNGRFEGPDIRQVAIVRAYQLLQRRLAMNVDPRSVQLALNALLSAMGRRYDQVGRHQDACEFLIELLDNLNDGLGQLTNTPTIIENLFGFNARHTLVCEHDHIGHRADPPAFAIPLAIAEDVTETELETCVRSLTEPSVIPDWACPHCNAARNAGLPPLRKGETRPPLLVRARQFSEWITPGKAPPPFLIFQCGLFGVDMEHKQVYKRDINIEFPDELVLDSRIRGIAEPDRFRYRVIATATHSGSVAGGHYIASVQMQGQWFRCNDERIHPHPNIHSDRPYVFFYQLDQPRGEEAEGDDQTGHEEGEGDDQTRDEEVEELA
jgi:ubiquitin C-terminal hydrolase